mgnify:CR=1 FL=1
MDTASLKTFMSIADSGSFTTAAEQLYLTQPAISKRIQALESELGARLFDRVGRQTLMTPAGEIFYKRAQIILQQLEDSLREIDNLSGEVAGTLHIGTSHHIGLHHLPPILKRLNQQYPELTLDIHFMDSEAAYREVHSGNLELGIITIPSTPEQELNSRIIWQDQLDFVVGKNHALAVERSHTIAMTPKILSQYDAILPAKNTYPRHILEAAFEKLGDKINTTLSTNYLETIKAMIQNGLGWGVLPESMIDDSLHRLKIKGVKMERHLGVLLHASRTLSSPVNALLETLKNSDRL